MMQLSPGRSQAEPWDGASNESRSPARGDAGSWFALLRSSFLPANNPNTAYIERSFRRAPAAAAPQFIGNRNLASAGAWVQARNFGNAALVYQQEDRTRLVIPRPQIREISEIRGAF